MPTRRIPSLNWLRVFEAAARAESFARAAESLNMSAPAVSQQIAALEAHLGAPLFHRSARRVRLTAAGRAFQPTVRHALAAVEASAAALFGAEGVEQITVRTDALLAMGWLPARIARFEAAHPGVRILVETGAEARARPADAAILFGPEGAAAPEAEPLLGETLSVVARADVAARLDGPGALIGLRLFEVAPHRDGWRHLLGDGADIAALEIATLDNTPLALMMAAEGLGAALARSPASDGMVRALGLAHCPAFRSVPGVERYHIALPAGARARKGAVAFRRWLRAEAARGA